MENFDVKKVVDELKTLISIPSYEDCDQIQTYLMERLNYIPFEKQYVGKGNLYNIHYLKQPFLINTHVDTVPPIDMKNPFEAVEKDGKIYGRGAADTKGLIASLIMALDMFKQNFPEKEIPVSIAFTVDEEQHTALGSEKLLEILDGISYSLVLEPTYGKICNKQMGTLEFELEVRSKSVHASEFEKTENPVKLAFDYINNVEKNLERPMNIIKFQSGWEYYATPKSAEILSEIKLFEGEYFEELEKRMLNLIEMDRFKGKIVYKRVDVEDFLDFGATEGFEILKDAYIKATGENPDVSIMPSWTDAANLYKKGISSTVFGFGSLADSHTEREHIAIQDLEKMTKVLYNFLTILSHLPASKTGSNPRFL